MAENEEQALENDMKLHSLDELIAFYSKCVEIPHEYTPDRCRLIYTRMLIRIYMKKIIRDHCE